MIFLNIYIYIYDTKTQTTKAKINKWDDIKLKSLYRSKEKNKMKIQSTEWEKNIC